MEKLQTMHQRNEDEVKPILAQPKVKEMESKPKPIITKQKNLKIKLSQKKNNHEC